MSLELFGASEKSKVKPILKWVGGKRELLPEIRLRYENLDFNKYVEPFFGGGAVYFDVLRTFGESVKETAIINDVNSDLINMYRHVKSNPKELIEAVNHLKGEYFNGRGYNFLRNRFNGIETGRISKEIAAERKKAGDPPRILFEKYEGIMRSAALITLNRTCFNGLYRVNPKGHFNVPKGNYKNPRILDEENLLRVSTLLPAVENIRNTQFDQIEEVSEGDLVYFDPPYHPLNETSSFVEYSGSFGSKEQIRLRDYFKSLDSKGVNVLSSNSSASYIKSIYNEFYIEEVFCRRNINSVASKRGKIPEYLILGSSIQKNQTHSSQFDQ